MVIERRGNTECYRYSRLPDESKISWLSDVLGNSKYYHIEIRMNTDYD